MLTALEGVDGASPVGDHIIRADNTGRLPGAWLIATNITRYTQLPRCTDV